MPNVNPGASSRGRRFARKSRTTEDPLGDGDVVLRPLTEENRPALEALRVATAQRAFVSSVTDSLAEAERYADANPLVFGLYDREMPVGFVMIADEVDDPDYIAHFLWKLLIDERFQRRGFGTAALDLVAAYCRSKGVPTMWTRTLTSARVEAVSHLAERGAERAEIAVRRLART